MAVALIPMRISPSPAKGLGEYTHYGPLAA